VGLALSAPISAVYASSLVCGSGCVDSPPTQNGGDSLAAASYTSPTPLASHTSLVSPRIHRQT
jgi:hypothetical protein